LNEEGKKRYGHIFSGDVPVVSMIPTVCGIEGHSERCYMIYHEELSEDEFDKFIANLAERFNVSKEEIKKHIASGKFENRIPLREKYVGGAGTNHPGFFG